jgi:hypothetical protein
VGIENLRIGIVCLLLALAPFAAWTWRNWHVFRVVEPLAPRHATDPAKTPTGVPALGKT